MHMLFYFKELEEIKNKYQYYDLMHKKIKKLKKGKKIYK